MITKEHELSWAIGEMIGANIVKESKLPYAGYCKKHGHYTLCVENSIAVHPMCVVFECPYCMAKNNGVSQTNNKQQLARQRMEVVEW